MPLGSSIAPTTYSISFVPASNALIPNVEITNIEPMMPIVTDIPTAEKSIPRLRLFTPRYIIMTVSMTVTPRNNTPPLTMTIRMESPTLPSPYICTHCRSSPRSRFFTEETNNIIPDTTENQKTAS